MAIIIYLESIQPTPPLLPSEAEQKALVFEFCEIINSGIQPLQNLSVVNRIKSEFGATEKQISDWTKHYVSAGLTTLETKLQKQAELYCFGDTVTAADVFLVPQVFSAKRIGISVDDYPKIKSIYGRLIQLEPFQKAEPSKQPDAE
jgi:maleylacetoacetate isomerase